MASLRSTTMRTSTSRAFRAQSKSILSNTTKSNSIQYYPRPKSIMGHIEEVPHRRRKLQVIFRKKMEERKIFIEDLHEWRLKNYRHNYKRIVKSIGPPWYQVLTNEQETAIKNLDENVYQDLLEGETTRTMKILKVLGIIPRPKKLDLLTCMYLGREDTNQFLARLFYHMFGHEYNGCRSFGYPLNARIILSAIFYLGLDDMIKALENCFEPEKPPKKKKPKPPQKPSLSKISPYLDDYNYIHCHCRKPVPKKPKPLPNLDHLNDAVEEEILIVTKPPPPPPAPPPPRKRQIPQSLCDKMSGYANRILPPPYTSKFINQSSTNKTVMKMRASQLCLTDTVVKRTYGLNKTVPNKIRKPKPPKLDLENVFYNIAGVYTHGSSSYYILSNVCLGTGNGILIHGGYRSLNNDMFRIHLGIQNREYLKEKVSCDCLQRWGSKAIDYLKKSKCHCGHIYCYGHDTSELNENLTPYFEKPGPKSGYQFNYSNIYEMDERVLSLQKDIQRTWDQDSILHDSNECTTAVKPKKKKKKEVVKRGSGTCLGDDPKVANYLRCAIRILSRTHYAARLPDVHLAPELKSWMQKRIFGDYSKAQKHRQMKRSKDCWVYLSALQEMGLGKTIPEKNPKFRNRNTWQNKSMLNRDFRRYIAKFRIKMYRTLINFNNLFWATMNQAKTPDKRFKDIFHCYMPSKLTDVTVLHPYNYVESVDRMLVMRRRRYKCGIKGVDDD